MLCGRRALQKRFSRRRTSSCEVSPSKHSNSVGRHFLGPAAAGPCCLYAQSLGVRPRQSRVDVVDIVPRRYGKVAAMARAGGLEGALTRTPFRHAWPRPSFPVCSPMPEGDATRQASAALHIGAGNTRADVLSPFGWTRPLAGPPPRDARLTFSAVGQAPHTTHCNRHGGEGDQISVPGGPRGGVLTAGAGSDGRRPGDPVK